MRRGKGEGKGKRITAVLGLVAGTGVAGCGASG